MSRDARSIARRQMGSEGVAASLKPSRGLRDDIVRRGGVPKDHGRANLQHIRAVEAKQKAKREEEAKPPQPSFVLPEFANVRSRVMDPVSEAGSRNGSPKPRRKEFAEARTRSGRKTAEASECHGPPGGMATAAPAPGDNGDGASSGSGGDLAVSTAGPRVLAKSRAANKNPPEPVKRTTKIGEVPRYLVNRKAEWAAEHERKEAEKRRIKPPPGTTLLSEEERLKTLQFLEKSHAELTAEMVRLPVTMGKTLSSMRKKQEMERKLEELEKATDIYKRDKVFIAL